MCSQGGHTQEAALAESGKNSRILQKLPPGCRVAKDKGQPACAMFL